MRIFNKIKGRYVDIEKETEEGLEYPSMAVEENADAESSEEKQHKPISLKTIKAYFKGPWLLKQLPWIMMIMIYCLILVWNRYAVESLTKEKIELTKDMEHIREKRIQMQKDYQESIKISRIASVLDTIGVQFISGPPYEIESEQ